ncbi:DUF3048 domain-containing protein [Candidatus Saccharibacteria bacterium]|nr:DUF3048 domain-containing protein [Candidatus Saccharibacteria bacterium]
MRDDIKTAKGPRRKVARLAEPKQETDEPKELAFKTPEETAQTDLPTEPKEMSFKNTKKFDGDKIKRFFSRSLSIKQWGLGFLLILIVIMGGVAYETKSNILPPPDTTTHAKTVYIPPKTTEPSRLTGVEIQKELNLLPTTAVQIENSPDARPQAGLYDAGIVTEAIAEGGITRFNAVYLEGQPERIGPVRSLRPYYSDFFLPYDAALAHAGGSGQALAEIGPLGIKSMDHGANGGTYSRDSNRFAPHNLYTSRARLLENQNGKGWTTSTFTSIVRKAEKKAETPTARVVDVAISSFLYNPRFEYDGATNSYLRVMAGKPHVDENGARQINPKVVIVLIMPHHYAGIYSVYQTTGAGKAYIFQDGTVVEGVWQKDGRGSQFVFGDANSAPIGLNPGQTWMTLASTIGQVTITP